MRMRHILSFVLFAVLALPIFAQAVEQSPWYPPEFLLRGHVDYLFQSYKRVATSNGSYHRNDNDNFLNLNLDVPYYDWYVKAGMLFADTRHRNFGLDSFYLEGRYQLMDDVDLADPISLVAGVSLTKATQTALHDISCFHHGRFECFVFLSAGKEISCNEFWKWHGWGSAGIGFADVGSPWLAGSLNLDRNYNDRHFFRLSVKALFGLGGENLHQHEHFHGYGPIQHRSIDLGGHYQYSLDSGIEISMGYYYRVYARNFPENTNRFIVSLIYPFSI